MEQPPELIRSKIKKIHSELNMEHQSNLDYPQRTTPAEETRQSLLYFDKRRPPSLQNLPKIIPVESKPKHAEIKRECTVGASVPNQQVLDLKRQNQILQDEIEYLHQQAKNEFNQFQDERNSMKEERKLMKDQQEQMEKLKDSNSLKDRSILLNQLEISKNEIKQQKSLTASFQEKNAELEERLQSAIRKLEKSVMTNKLVIERASELDERLNETHQKWLTTRKENEVMDRFVRTHKDTMNDYENSLQELDLYLSVPEELQHKRPDILTRHVIQLVKDRKDVQIQNKKLKEEIQLVERDLEKNNHKYMIDIEQKRSLLQLNEEKRDSLESEVRHLKNEMKTLEKENLRLSLQITRLDEEHRNYVLKSEEEHTELITKTASQIKSMREQFEADRCDLRISLDKAQRHKIDLQAEVGQLLRDRRVQASEFFQRDPRLNKFCF